MKKNIRVIGDGNDCPKCGKPMQRREHATRPKKTWYYTKWDICVKCRHIQHYEEFKSSDWQEIEQQESFFNSLR